MVARAHPLHFLSPLLTWRDQASSRQHGHGSVQMQVQEPITVMSFHTHEGHHEIPLVAPFKATREQIVERYRGHPLEGTAEKVDPAALDEQGRYRRVATGWGDLR
jgi:hypothetical protein